MGFRQRHWCRLFGRGSGHDEHGGTLQGAAGMSVITFIGLGSMGLPMARNLMAKGHEVRGVDLNEQACAAFAKDGGKVTLSAAQAARGAEMLILMVVNADQARQVLEQDGVLAGLVDTGTVCVMATCQPAAMPRSGEHTSELQS